MGINTLPVAGTTGFRVWTIQTTPDHTTAPGYASGTYPGNPSTKVYYLGNRYIFGTDRGYICYSTDAKNWSWQKVLSATNSVYAIAYNGTNWVCVGQNNQCYSASTLGGTWTARTSQITGTNTIYDCVWVGGSINLFILCGGITTSSVAIATSSDGITWTGRVTAGVSGYGIAVNTAQTTIIVGSNSTTASQQGWYSTNGTSYTLLPITTGTTAAFGGVDYLPHIDRFTSWANTGLRQSPANVATTWNSQVPQPSNMYPTRPINQMSWNNDFTNKIKLTWDSTNSCYYAVDNNNNLATSGAIFTTFSGSIDRLVYNDGSNAYYDLQPTRQDPLPLPTFQYTTSSGTDSATQPAVGIGAGIIVVVARRNSQGYSNTIFTTPAAV